MREGRERGAPDTVRALRMLQVASFTSAFDRLAIAAMLVVIATELDGSVNAVSHAVAAYFFCYGVAQVGWGVVSDRLGRVRTMRLAFLLAAVGNAAAAAAPGTTWLIVARAVTGACFAAAIPGALVYIGDTVPVRVRQAPLTDVMTTMALGMAVATVTAGALADFTSWRVTFALAGTLAAALAVAMRGMTEPELPPPAPVGASLRAVLGDPWARLVLGFALTEGFVLLGPLTFLPAALTAGGLRVTWAGLATAAYGLAVLFFARVVKRRSRTTAPARLILIGGTQCVVAYLLLTVHHGVVPVIAGLVLLGGGWAYMHSTLQTWATDVAPAARATAVSLFAAMLFTGSAAGAAVAGPLVGAMNFRPLFAVALGVAVPLTLVATLARRRYGARGS